METKSVFDPFDNQQSVAPGTPGVAVTTPEPVQAPRLWYTEMISKDLLSQFESARAYSAQVEEQYQGASSPSPYLIGQRARIPRKLEGEMADYIRGPIRPRKMEMSGEEAWNYELAVSTKVALDQRPGYGAKAPPLPDPPVHVEPMQTSMLDARLASKIRENGDDRAIRNLSSVSRTKDGRFTGVDVFAIQNAYGTDGRLSLPNSMLLYSVAAKAKDGASMALLAASPEFNEAMAELKKKPEVDDISQARLMIEPYLGRIAKASPDKMVGYPKGVPLVNSVDMVEKAAETGLATSDTLRRAVQQEIQDANLKRVPTPATVPTWMREAQPVLGYRPSTGVELGEQGHNVVGSLSDGALRDMIKWADQNKDPEALRLAISERDNRTIDGAFKQDVSPSLLVARGVNNLGDLATGLVRSFIGGSVWLAHTATAAAGAAAFADAESSPFGGGEEAERMRQYFQDEVAKNVDALGATIQGVAQAGFVEPINRGKALASYMVSGQETDEYKKAVVHYKENPLDALLDVLVAVQAVNTVKGAAVGAKAGIAAGDSVYDIVKGTAKGAKEGFLEPVLSNPAKAVAKRAKDVSVVKQQTRLDKVVREASERTNALENMSPTEAANAAALFTAEKIGLTAFPNMNRLLKYIFRAPSSLKLKAESLQNLQRSLTGMGGSQLKAIRKFDKNLEKGLRTLREKGIRESDAADAALFLATDIGPGQQIVRTGVPLVRRALHDKFAREVTTDAAGETISKAQIAAEASKRMKVADRYITEAARKYVFPEGLESSVREAMSDALGDGQKTAGAAMSVLEGAIPNQVVTHLSNAIGIPEEVARTAIVFNKFFGKEGLTASNIYHNVINHPWLKNTSEFTRKTIAADLIDQTLPKLVAPEGVTTKVRIKGRIVDVPITDVFEPLRPALETIMDFQNKNMADLMRMDALPAEVTQHLNRHMSMVPKKSMAKLVRYATRMARGKMTLQERADFAALIKSQAEKLKMDPDAFKSDMYSFLVNNQGLDSLRKRSIPAKLFRGPEWSEAKTQLAKGAFDARASLYQTARTAVEQRMAIDAMQGIWGEAVFTNRAIMEIMSGGLSSPETVQRFGKTLDGVSGITGTEQAVKRINAILDTAETAVLPSSDKLLGLRRIAEAKGWTLGDDLLRKAGISGNLPKGIYVNPEVRGLLEHMADMRATPNALQKLNRTITKSFKMGKVVLPLNTAVRDIVFNKITALPMAGVPVWSKWDTVAIRSLASDSVGMKRLADTVGASGAEIFQRELGTAVRTKIPWGIQDTIAKFYDEVAGGTRPVEASVAMERNLKSQVKKLSKTTEGRKVLGSIASSYGIDGLDNVARFFFDLAFRPDKTKLGQAAIANRGISDDAARMAVAMDRVIGYAKKSGVTSTARAMGNLLEELGFEKGKKVSNTRVGRAINAKLRKIKRRDQGTAWFDKHVAPIIDSIDDDTLRTITQDAVDILPNYADKSRAWKMITNNLFVSPFLYFTANMSTKMGRYWLDKPFQARMHMSMANGMDSLSWDTMGGQGEWQDVRKNLPVIDQYTAPWFGTEWSSKYVPPIEGLTGLFLGPLVPVSRTGEDTPFDAPPGAQAVAAAAGFIQSGGQDVKVPQVYDPKSGRVIQKRITSKEDTFLGSAGKTAAYLYDLLGPAGDLLPIRPGFKDEEPIIGSPALRGVVSKAQGKFSPDYGVSALRAFGPRPVPLSPNIAAGREADALLRDIAQGGKPRVVRLIDAIGQDLRTEVNLAQKRLKEETGDAVRSDKDGSLSVHGENMYRGRLSINRADAFVTNAMAAAKLLGSVANSQVIANMTLGPDNASLIDFSSNVMNDYRLALADAMPAMQELRDAYLAGQDPPAEKLDAIASMLAAPLGNANVTWQELMSSAEMQKVIKPTALPGEAQADAAMARINGIDKRIIKSIQNGDPKALERAVMAKAGDVNPEAEIMRMINVAQKNDAAYTETGKALVSLLSGPLGPTIPRAKPGEGAGWFSDRPVNNVTSWYQAPGISDTRRDEVAAAIVNGRRFVTAQDVIEYFNDMEKKGRAKALSTEERTNIRRLFRGGGGGLAVPK